MKPDQLLNAAGEAWSFSYRAYKECPWWRPVKKFRRWIWQRQRLIFFEVMMDVYGELTK